MAAPIGPALLEVAGLSKRFPGGAGVCDVSFAVPAGSITGFIGVNGAGKSTTLRCIVGLIRPDAGRIGLFGGQADATARRRIGFLPEERGLFPRDRARDVIAFNARLQGVARKDALREADRLLERIGLAQRQTARIGELSKGNAQRVQILCALAHRPDLLLLDEPLSGLDPVGQSEILALFAELRAQGASILFSTHAMASAERVCDRVVMLSAGRTVFEGAVDEASAHARHGAMIVTPDAEALVAAVARLGGEASPVPGAIGDATRWRIVLPPETPHPALVRALAEAGVQLMAFEPIRADLEGAFWDLAAPSARRAA